MSLIHLKNFLVSFIIISLDFFFREFKLVLRPDESVFAKDAKLDKQGLVDTSHIYRGTLEGKSAENKMQYFDMVLRSINF